MMFWGIKEKLFWIADTIGYQGYDPSEAPLGVFAGVSNSIRNVFDDFQQFICLFDQIRFLSALRRTLVVTG